MKDIKKAYVIGSKTSQSLSPTIFNYWFEKYDIRALYDFIEIGEKNFNKEIKKILKEKNLCGLNITIPHKENIIQHIDSFDRHSKKIGAINCVTINKNKTYGSNTDWIGFCETLKNNKINKKNTALLIGYGGAAKAILYGMRQYGFKDIHVFNRSTNKLPKNSLNRVSGHPLFEIENYLETAGIIVNTAPVNILKKLKIKKPTTEGLIFDIVYSPVNTSFLKNFSKKNKKINGLNMLVNQAAPCFKKWFGITPEPDKRLFNILTKAAPQ